MVTSIWVQYIALTHASFCPAVPGRDPARSTGRPSLRAAADRAGLLRRLCPAPCVCNSALWGVDTWVDTPVDAPLDALMT